MCYLVMNGHYTDNLYAAEAVQLAKAILDGSLSMVDGCRKLWKPLYKNFANKEPAIPCHL